MPKVRRDQQESDASSSSKQSQTRRRVSKTGPTATTTTTTATTTTTTAGRGRGVGSGRGGAATAAAAAAAGGGRDNKNSSSKVVDESDSKDQEGYRALVEAQLLAFEPKDIYHCDEVVLDSDSFRKKKTLYFAADGPPPVYQSTGKTSFVVLLCSNASGSDKREPFVPSLKTNNESSSSTSNSASDKITQSQFDQWVKELDQDLQQQDRKIALLVHHNNKAAIAIMASETLSNITILRLPRNTTSFNRPLNLRIIRSFKTCYSEEQTIQAIRGIESLSSSSSSSSSSSTPNDVHFSSIVNSWNKVPQSLIRDGFVGAVVIPDRHKDHLRNLPVESKKDQAIRLWDDLMKKQPDMEGFYKEQDLSTLRSNTWQSSGISSFLGSMIDNALQDDKFRSYFKNPPPKKK
ncbi:hypothetical protein BGZ65_003296 [Modicella reniformis]|uniref:DDE-1 domain-containing protein n=1 Tax=Modicella reniformis TaxID=1440133 RepID=A0A9P6MI26_9FUNG|nr:hypothetical protein BGZ65_003296 [Modicella reniformis]